MVHFGPCWPEEVHFGPFRSANRTLAIPEQMCTIVDDCAQITEWGPKPPYESPHLDLPNVLFEL